MEYKVLILPSWLWCQLFSSGRSLHPGPEPAGLRWKPIVLQFLPWCDAFRIWDFVYAMWCLHMPRQLRLLLPAACVKELAAPLSSCQCLALPCLNPLCSFPGPAGHLASGSSTVWLDSPFSGDCFGLSMSKHMYTHPQAPSASAGGGKHLHFAPEPSLQGLGQHTVAPELLLGLGGNNILRPQICGVWKSQFIVGP